MNERQGLYLWQDYWGELLADDDESFPSIVYGFENVSQRNHGKTQVDIPHLGTCFGFIQQGGIKIRANQHDWILSAQQWFSLPAGLHIELGDNVRMVVLQLKNYAGVCSMGGPIESQGRLRYIDGCSDTLLCAPPLKGDPCLNQLHFPHNIDQTEHNHPSARAGIVASGNGLCQIPGATHKLNAGMIFYIKPKQNHKFQTQQDQNLNIIAYHPDSDWGPTHEEHPMINRTWVDGKKIDNSQSQHVHSNIIQS